MSNYKFIDSKSIERILDISLPSTVIARYVNLQRKGKDFFGCCPFHQEKTPSFSVNDSKGFFYCFGCGEKGSVVDFIKKIHGFEYKEAIEHLADLANIKLEYVEKERSKEIINEQNEHDILYKILEESCKWFQAKLNDINNSFAYNYLTSRGLKKDIIAKFRLGYAPDSKLHNLYGYLKKLGFEDKHLLKIGVFTQKYDKIYNYFFNRIIFPIFNNKGKVIAFGGRILGAGEPKYLNSPETILFKKNSLLYGLNFNRDQIYRQNKMLIVEGYMDVISLYNSGFEYAVAPLGTAFTDNHLELSWKIINEPILCFDGDFAGQNAASKVVLNSLNSIKADRLLKIITLPEKYDPDDAIKEFGVERFQQYVEKAVNISEYLWQRYSKLYDLKVPEDRSKLKSELDKLVNKVTDQILKKNLRSYFSDQLFKSSIYEQKNNSKKLSVNKISEMLSNQNFSLSKKHMLALQIIYLIINYPDKFDDDEKIEFISNLAMPDIAIANIQSIALEYINNKNYNNSNFEDYLKINNIQFDYISYNEMMKPLFYSLSAYEVVRYYEYLANMYILEIMYEEYNNLLKNVEEYDTLNKIRALSNEIHKIENTIYLVQKEAIDL